MLGLGVLLEEGVGEAALEVTQEPFRFQNQPSLRRENGIITKQESESDLFEEGNGIIIEQESESDLFEEENGIIIEQESESGLFEEGNGIII